MRIRSISEDPHHINPDHYIASGERERASQKVQHEPLAKEKPSWALGGLPPKEFLANLAAWVEIQYETKYGLNDDDVVMIYGALKKYKIGDLYNICAMLKLPITQPKKLAELIASGEVDLHDLQDPAEEANHRPAAALPQGTPPIQSLPPNVVTRLKQCNAAALVDYYHIDHTQPFIYDATNDKLFIGARGMYHGKILNAFPPSSSQSLMVRNVYQGGEYHTETGDYIRGSGKPGAVGRIGHGLRDIDRALVDAAIISIYARDNTTLAIAKEVIKQLVEKKYSPPNAYVVYGSELSTAKEFLVGGIEADSAAIELGKLQVALHIGAWPNGKRLTPQEKEVIRKKLGIPTVQKQQPWAGAMQKAGLGVPGAEIMGTDFRR